ncbi:MAG: hypothetical protein WED07_01140 [Candidatus Freyarchaeum deiterrae]
MKCKVISAAGVRKTEVLEEKINDWLKFQSKAQIKNVVTLGDWNWVVIFYEE